MYLFTKIFRICQSEQTRRILPTQTIGPHFHRIVSAYMCILCCSVENNNCRTSVIRHGTENLLLIPTRKMTIPSPSSKIQLKENCLILRNFFLNPLQSEFIQNQSLANLKVHKQKMMYMYHDFLSSSTCTIQKHWPIDNIHWRQYLYVHKIGGIKNSCKIRTIIRSNILQLIFKLRLFWLNPEAVWLWWVMYGTHA